MMMLKMKYVTYSFFALNRIPFSASDLRGIRGYFPNARLLQVANAGHWVHSDQPHTVLHLLSAFLRDPQGELLTQGVREVNDWD